MPSHQSIIRPQYIIGETITGAWNHGRVGEAVSRLLSPQNTYIITERLPSGDVVRTTSTTGCDIQKKCAALLGVFTHIYEVTDRTNSIVLKYVPGGRSPNISVH